MSHEDAKYYRSTEAAYPTYFRVYTEYDEDAESPREWENITQMVTVGGDFNSPDHKLTLDHLGVPTNSDYLIRYSHRDQQIHAKFMGRWLALFASAAGIHAWAFLRQGHRDGTLAAYHPDEYDNEDYYSGLVVITTQAWQDNFPAELTGPDAPSPREVIDAEILNYNNWAEGYYQTVVVESAEFWTNVHNPDDTRQTWETHSSLGGVDGSDDSYLDEVVADLLPGNVEQITKSELPEGISR